MHDSPRFRATRLIVAGILLGVAAPAICQVSVRTVKVLGSNDVVELEVEASDRIVPQTQVLSGPDRLVIDFPNSRPTDQVRSQSVDRGEVKDVRVGLFQSNPPVTRLVVDLKTAQNFQVFPNGRTVMIKIMGMNARTNSVAQAGGANSQPSPQAGLVAANYSTSSEPVHIEAVTTPPLQVSYQNGMLGVHSDRATLAEVLFAIQKKTGAEIPIPAGAEQERVAADIGPAPAPEVLATLLNGSKFNFLILSAANDPTRLDRVILSTRTEGNFVAPLPQVENNNGDDTQDEEPAVVNNQPDNPIPPQVAAQPQQTRPAPDADSSDQ
jgi:AMIN domain